MIAATVMEGVPVSGAGAEEWASVDAAALSEPNTSLFWSQALVAGHIMPSDRTFTVLVRDGKRLISVVPAVIRREKVVGAMNVSVVRLMADLSTAHSDFLRADRGGHVAEEFVGALRQLPWPWDVLRIGNLLECSPIIDALMQSIAVSGFKYRFRREQPSYFLDLPPDYEGFLMSRSAKFRSYLRRMSRRLEALGRLEVRRAGKDIDTAQAYQDLLEVEERSWKHARGTAITRVERQREFYRQLCFGAAQAGRLHLLVLYLDGRPIAFDLGVTTADRYSYLKTSFDEAFRAASPATVLRARLVESLILEGFRSLDFPAEPYEWEEQWSSRVRWHRSVLMFNRTSGGSAYRALMNLRNFLRTDLDHDQVRHVDPRA